MVLSVEYECATCCRTKCPAKLSLFLFLPGIVPTFIFGSDRAKHFLAATTTFGSWHMGTRGIHTEFNIFGSEKRLWQNSAKNKSWHDLCQKQKLANTTFLPAFCTYTLSLTLYKFTHTTAKNTPKASHLTTHPTQHTTQHIDTSHPPP